MVELLIDIEQTLVIIASSQVLTQEICINQQLVEALFIFQDIFFTISMIFHRHRFYSYRPCVGFEFCLLQFKNSNK